MGESFKTSFHIKIFQIILSANKYFDIFIMREGYFTSCNK